jgi:hypothetical protein
VTNPSFRAALQQRLAIELGDGPIAREIASRVDDDSIERLATLLADGDPSTSPLLSYQPYRIAGDEVDSLWILAFGYRLADPSTEAELAGTIPPMSALIPGPINEALAHEAADFVARRPVPIVAQWEAARVLADLGVANVISVEPDIDDAGTITYLSTAGVVSKGLTLAAAAGVAVGRAGLLAHADHGVRGLSTAAAAGLDAAVPEGVTLPVMYDAKSGQPWTRSRVSYLSADLLARSYSV